jgi:hypothetical protein
VFKTSQWHCPGKCSSCAHRDKEGTNVRFPCHLLSRQEGVRGGGKQNSAHSQSQHFMAVSGLFQVTVVLIPGKKLWYPQYRRLCGSQIEAGHGEGKTSYPLSLPKDCSRSLSVVHCYKILERYNAIYSVCTAFAQAHTYTECSAWGSKLLVLDVWAHLSRLRLKRDGTHAETRFCLSAKRTSPFKSVGASVQSTTGSRGVRISCGNAGYTMFRGSVKSTGYPLHSPVSPSLPLQCVTVCHQVSNAL